MTRGKLPGTAREDPLAAAITASSSAAFRSWSAGLTRVAAAATATATLFLGSAFDAPACAAESFTHGFFNGVQVDRPRGDVKQFVLFLGSGQGDEQSSMALVAKGAMVVRIDAADFYGRLEKASGECTSADGSLENLSRHVQAFYKLPTYLTPIVVGREMGATLAYAMAAQALPGALVGVVSVGFCPELTAVKPLCPVASLRMSKRTTGDGFDVRPAEHLNAPWLALQPSAPVTSRGACNADADAARPFVASAPQAALAALPANADAAATDRSLAAAVGSLASRQTLLAPPPASLANLPIVEVAADPGSPAGNRLAILLSGDGGWAGIDKGIAASLAQRGIPVAGFDSLRYFWSKRTPEGLAKDLDRMVRFYSARWKKSEVVLIGYSQGADVLPFAINRLPTATRAKIRLTALLGLAQKASFEFHVSNWLGPSGDRPIAPEGSKLNATDTLCIHGEREPQSLCPALAPAHVTALRLPGDHHFDGAYDRLAAAIADQAELIARR